LLGRKQCTGSARCCTDLSELVTGQGIIYWEKTSRGEGYWQFLLRNVGDVRDLGAQ